MQTTTSAFSQKANGAMRKITHRALMSFPRQYLPSVTFFTIGVSTIGGSDIIKGVGDVVAEWDKYQYDDYSYRIKSIEVTRQEENFNSTTLAQADVVMENHDNYFTPNRGSVIDEFILPYRPIKLAGGFGQEAVPQFVGLTEKMPTVEEKSKTISFHAIDFMYSLFNRPLDQAVMYQDMRTDQILAALLVAFGISPTQYNFDMGYNIIAFAFFDKGAKFGDVVKKLMQAEMGRFFMDEEGVIRFKNRQNYSSTPVWFFNETNIIDIQTSKQDDIVNVVEIKANVREVQANQKFWELQSAVRVPANSTLTLWADFEDPVTTVDDPEYITTATTSLFTTNKAEDGSGDAVSTNFTLSDSTIFSKSYQMEFTNTNGFDVYITTLELFARPAKIVKELYIREEDSSSVAKYDERVLTIENEFFNDEAEATSRAKIILDDEANYANTYILTVKGNPALQIGDAVNVSVFGSADTFVIKKFVNRWEAGKFSQILTVKKKTFRTFFTVGISTIGGVDVIAP
jgi:hypothetical protein